MNQAIGRLLGVLTVAGMVLPGAAMADTTLTDNTFDLGTPGAYTVQQFVSNPAITAVAQQCAACGNPGTALQFQITMGDNGGIADVGVISNSLTYSPGASGTIAGLVASVDKNLTSTAERTFGNFFRPMVEQDGQFFVDQAGVSGPLLIGPGTTGYLLFNTATLTADDFVSFDFATGQYGSSNPDFAGDPLSFGLMQVLGPSPISVPNFEADYDNLTFQIAAVPEPASALLLAGGLAVLGWRRRYAAPRSTR